MLHPDTRLKPIANTGYGVVATALIPKGTIVWVQDPLDRVLTADRVASLPALLRAAVRNHGYFDRRHRIVLCWDHTRYVNHSCEPNCVSPGHAFELAVRDIHVGEQLTNDYLTLNLTCTFECQCGGANGRKLVHGACSTELVEYWDDLIRDTVPDVPNVEQPLRSMLNERDSRDLQKAIDLVSPLRSCQWHLRDPLPLPD